MEYERGAENLPVDMDMSTEQHGVALGFIMKQQREIATRATVSTLSTPRVESLKLHLNSYVGREGEPPLRWLVEVDTAITARRIVDPLSKVAFAMSCLGGRARSWAYGRRLTDPTCFSTCEVFKEELRKAFEPPQNEFRSTAEFLDLQQGKHDVHAYAQRARYLVSNIVTNPIDEAPKVVTFMKGLRDGPVKTYLFREYPGTLQAAITLAMQEVFSLRQAKTACECPTADAAAGGEADGRSRTDGPLECDGCWTPAASWISEWPPAGDAVERVDIGHAISKTGAPSEIHSHCKKKDDKPNLVMLKVNSKRERSHRALVDCGASNNFVRLQILARLDFEEVELPRSLLEVRLATGVVVRTEKKFVDELIVLDLDDKFDMVLDMPRLARHDPVIDWAKRTIRVVREKCEPNQKTQLRSDLRVSRSVKGDAVVSTAVDTQVEQERSVTQCSDLGASAPGADATGPNIEGRSAVRRQGKRGASAPGADAASSADDGAREPSDASVGVYFTSSYELEVLPQDKDGQHEIDLVPGTKYCVTRQWPLPREQVKAIDDFFETRRKAGQVRESKSPYSSPTFCGKKAQCGWHIVHAYNKLNDATIPAQTPIPRKDVIIDSMALSTIFSALDLREGFYQILMRESDIPLTAVSTPSGILWEWLVVPQGLKNAPATFNRCVTHFLRSVRDFAPSYFDDVFIHSRAVNGKSDVEMHKEHFRKLFALMRKHKLYANLKKCIFGASEIPVLGCLMGKNGVRPDPGKVRVVSE
ncbi:unnamed protein product [Phytophthora fragariaefolia]|uniref:Unnamed protein product n=1 Tax=Phytophthora fragariaefolia TaxID=1490495 RepID=A0A9W6XQE1_9STRA|nr:unnamed protein product [Phytophthora fragariaefolia]